MIRKRINAGERSALIVDSPTGRNKQRFALLFQLLEYKPQQKHQPERKREPQNEAPDPGTLVIGH